jgi:hypothetical protein
MTDAARMAAHLASGGTAAVLTPDTMEPPQWAAELNAYRFADGSYGCWLQETDTTGALLPRRRFVAIPAAAGPAAEQDYWARSR